MADKYYLYCETTIPDETDDTIDKLLRLVFGPFDDREVAFKTKLECQEWDSYKLEQIPCETLQEACGYFTTDIRDAIPFNSMDEMLQFQHSARHWASVKASLDSTQENLRKAEEAIKKEWPSYPWYKRWWLRLWGIKP